MNRIRCTSVTCAALVAAAGATSAHSALVTSWINAAGGDFGSPGNWTMGVPTPTDTALFDLDAVYAVTIELPTQVARVLVRSGVVTFDTASVIAATSQNAAMPSVIVGELAGDDATLSIDSGLLSAAFIHVADVPVAVGALEVAGPGVLDASGVVYVGRRGTGSLEVTAASVAVRWLALGVLSTGTGDASIASSPLIVDETLVVGQFGGGSMEIVDASTARCAQMLVAQNYLSTGATVVDGGSTLTIDGSLDVGRGGIGSLEIRGGSQVHCDLFASIATLPETFFLPKFPASQGTVVVTGAGAVFDVGTDLFVPLGGFATLDIRDGGQVLVGDDLVFNVPERTTIAMRFDAADGAPAIVVTDDVAASGSGKPVALSLAFAEGFVPALGQSFDLMRAATIIAEFAPTLPALPIGLTWQFGVVDVDATQVLRARIIGATDINGDGIVDGADMGLLLANWGGTVIGDINGDGVVDGADLGVLLGAFSGTTP